MAKRKETDYVFADSYIGTFSKYLMTKKDLMRVAMCKDFDSAETILREYGYGETQELKNGDIEWFIRREQNKLFKLLFDTIPDREELAFMLYPFDYHNVKVCLKAEIMGIVPDDNYLLTTGYIDWHQIVGMVKERAYDFMPVPMKEGIVKAMEVYSRSKDPQDIDIILDKACYKQMIVDVKKTGNDFLIGFMRCDIDTLNLQSFARVKQLKKGRDFFETIYLEGGNVSLKQYLDSFEEPLPRFGEKLAAYGYKKVLEIGGKVLEETGNFDEFEKQASNALMDYVKNAKNYTFGINPIAGYWYAKESEIDNLRIVLRGMLTKESPEKIEERLRDTYV